MTADHDDGDADDGSRIDHPVTVDIRCTCGNHARYLELAPGSGLCCALCAMASKYETIRISDNPSLLRVLTEGQESMGRLATCMAAHMAAIVGRQRQ
jgi:hypothetical protein